nr:hypothetical protein Iba_chr06cCG4100 [Ipomoea batatas]GMD09876.1 hypothetical protein Iba_chr06eCG0840 [Ipomoea batatas]
MAVKIVPRIADVMTFTITENFAASGLPPPSSFETLTLTDALKPRATMSAQSCKFTQMDTESTATAALLSPPTMRITAVKYHSSKHSIAAEASDSFTKLNNDLKANHEKPVHESEKDPETM